MSPPFDGSLVFAGHLPRRVLDDARRLDGLLKRVGRRAELGRRDFTDVMLLHNSVLPRLLISRDHARQLPDQQYRNSAYEEEARHERPYKLIIVRPSAN